MSALTQTCVVSTLVAATASAALAEVTIRDLGTFGGATTRAYGINGKGQVAGQSGGSAFLWLPTADYGLPAGMHDLGSLGGPTAVANGLNDLGQVVGESMTGDGQIEHGFLWLPDTDYGLQAGMNDLGTLPGGVLSNFSQAYAISNDGVVVGEVQYNYWGIPCRWTQPGATIDGLGSLAPPGSTYNWGAAYDINSVGQIAGYSEISGDHGPDHGFLWTEDGTDGPPHNPRMRDLGDGLAFGLNDLGDVVGTFGLWQNDTFTDIGGEGLAINNSRQIVGRSGGRAFLWEDGAYIDLTSLLPDGSPWDVLLEASDINEMGVIAGFGLMNGETRAFTLVIPAPTATSILASVLLVPSRRRRAD